MRVKNSPSTPIRCSKGYLTWNLCGRIRNNCIQHYNALLILYQTLNGDKRVNMNLETIRSLIFLLDSRSLGNELEEWCADSQLFNVQSFLEVVLFGQKKFWMIAICGSWKFLWIMRNTVAWMSRLAWLLIRLCARICPWRRANACYRWQTCQIIFVLA